MNQRVLGYPKCTLNCLAGVSSQLTRGSNAVGWKLPLSKILYGQSKWIRKIAFPQVKPVTEGVRLSGGDSHNAHRNCKKVLRRFREAVPIN